MDSKFATVPDKPNFSDEEVKVLKYWNEIKAFEQQLEKSKGKPKFTFYDGPPFATGLPHYGHIAAGTIKDVVTRYATMKGHYVERRFGWDCHGLPIEFEIDKIHKITSSVEREALGVKKYNELCREIVMRFSKEWETVVQRFGRWIDFENDYKTMDAKYMESVWWTFKQIFERGLVYRGTKIMPFSTACNTVLSNSEAGSNYKDVNDPAIIVVFPALKDEFNSNLIAWTTTPWTLPSNLALACNPKMDYVRFRDEATEKIYICMKDRLKYVIQQTRIAKHTVLDTFKGEKLVGVQYEPLFPYFEDRRATNCFSVMAASFVTKDAGTGIVHCAPGFGEDDYAACVANKLIEKGSAPTPIDQDGKFLPVIKEYAGIYVKEADPKITEDIKKMGRLLSKGTIKHSYPFCWRSQTPLLYRGFNCWFIDVQSIKQDLIGLNKTNKWVPSFVQEKRFHNWLEDARDWCFSRTRFWGNPIPIWTSEDGEEIVCIGSVAELEELSGVKVTDLHKEYVDEITIPSKQGKGVLRRIPEVFDCWFESGSMPFAQSHYPFSTKDEEFAKGFPANFIAEGLDQTRGWFYSLMVISTAVKNCAPFKNLIVNGIVLAEDGSKMSKSKKNYPDPSLVADHHGADAVRLYLCNSPVVRAESLKFAEEGVHGVVREIFLPWFNAYRFLIQNITRWEKRTGKNFVFDESDRMAVFSGESNYMDKWIISANQELIKNVRKEMDQYHLYAVVRHILSFREDLTNWYVRLNRPRMKGEDNTAEDQKRSLNVLYDVLLSFTQLMAPITPFLSEHMFLNLKNGFEVESSLNQPSIHLTDIPAFDESLISQSALKTLRRMQNAVVTGRTIRDSVKISIKYPLQTLVLIDADQTVLEGFKKCEEYIKTELNCMELVLKENEDDYVVYKAEGENRACGQAFGKKFNKDFKKKIEQLTSEEIRTFLADGKIVIDGLEVTDGMLKISKTFKKEYLNHKKWAAQSSMLSSVMIDTEQNEDLINQGLAREVVNRIQRLRKTSGISIEDQIEIFYELAGSASQDTVLGKVVSQHSDKIMNATKMTFGSLQGDFQDHAVKIGETEFIHPDMPEEQVKLHIFLAAPKFNDDKLAADFGSHSTNAVDFVRDLKSFVLQLSRTALQRMVEENNGELRFSLNGQSVALKHREHFFFDARDRMAQ